MTEQQQFVCTNPVQALGTLQVFYDRLDTASRYFCFDGFTFGRIRDILDGMWVEAASKLEPGDD